MKKFTKTDRCQFLDELHFLKLNKRFDGVFIDSFKGFCTLKDIDETLDLKRKDFNIAVTNLFRFNGLAPDDFYSDLDRTWNDIHVEEAPSYESLQNKKIFGSMIPIGMMPPFSLVSLGLPTLTALLITRCFRANKKWEAYKRSVTLLAEKYSESALSR